jgi:prevent-host-death family protein
MMGVFIMETISSAKAKEEIESLIDSVNSDGDPPIIVNKKGNEAVLISLDNFNLIQQAMAVISSVSNEEEFEAPFDEADFIDSLDQRPKPLKTDYIQVYQFKITLNGIRPPIWRRIQVPSNYTFWDLHVAIQDAMGWFDCHLHEFYVNKPSSDDQERIGIPLDVDIEFDEESIRSAGWKHQISHYLSPQNPKAIYVYDFGDGWEHTITFEKVLPREKGKSYPTCLKGKRACPPEDCGGVWGYKNLLEIIADPDHEEYDARIEWLGEDFDPEAFDVALIKFDDPMDRWEFTFEEADE